MTVREIANFVYGRKHIYPASNTAYTFLQTAPITVASNERSFSKLKLVKTKLRSTMLQDRLESLMLISCEKDFSQNVNLKDVVWQDNALPHTSQFTKAFLDRHGWKLLPWPSQYPDRNIIENVWQYMKTELNRNPKKKQEPVERVLEIWAAVPKSAKLVYSTSEEQNADTDGDNDEDDLKELKAQKRLQCLEEGCSGATYMRFKDCFCEIFLGGKQECGISCLELTGGKRLTQHFTPLEKDKSTGIRQNVILTLLDGEKSKQLDEGKILEILFTVENKYSRLGPELMLCLDIAIATGGSEAITESFYAVMNTQEQKCHQ
eukprot:gene645-1313_t